MEHKYYKLKEKYFLRGWEKLPCGVIDTETGHVGFLPPEEFSALTFCTGNLDSGGLLFDDKKREILERLETYGLTEVSDNPSGPINAVQKYRKYPNPFLESIQWSITGKCNYKCRHCYMEAPDSVLPQISKADAFKAIKEMASCGVVNIALTGGEALTHPDFYDILKELRRNNIGLSTVYSNGFLINEDFIKIITEIGFHPTISLSFDGTAGWHEWIRQIEDAGTHIEKAFKICKENGLVTEAEFCIHKGNRHTLRDSINLLDSWGCSFMKVNSLSADGCGKNIAEYILNEEEIAEICMDYLPAYYEDRPRMEIILCGCLSFSGPDKPPMPYDRSINGDREPSKILCCKRARTMMYLDSEGYCVPCIPFADDPLLKNTFPNIFKERLSDILNGSKYTKMPYMTLQEYFDRNPDCAACRYRFECASGCRGCAAKESGGDIYAKHEAICRFFLSGKYDRLKAECEKFASNLLHFTH